MSNMFFPNFLWPTCHLQPVHASVKEEVQASWEGQSLPPDWWLQEYSFPVPSTSQWDQSKTCVLNYLLEFLHVTVLLHCGGHLNNHSFGLSLPISINPSFPSQYLLISSNKTNTNHWFKFCFWGNWSQENQCGDSWEKNIHCLWLMLQWDMNPI